MKKWLKIGQALKPHGIKGEALFQLFNEEQSSLDYIDKIRLLPLDKSSSLDSEGEDYVIENIRFGNKVIVKIKDILDRTMLEKILPFEIFINEQDLRATQEDEFYFKDLLGLDVYDFKTQEKKGKVQSFYSNGAQDILVIHGNNNVWEIPFVDQFVRELNIEEGKILISFPQIIE